MLTISRRAGQTLELGDPHAPALRIRVDSVNPDSAELTLNLLKPGRILPREELTSGRSTPEPRGTTHTLSRRTGQAFLYGDPWNPMAVVEITAINQDRVRLSVSCDRSIEVHRLEVAEQIRSDDLSQ